ncbi:MAG: pyruvate kinase [Armatimonadetes bacterium]|nr:pyruvate kinase [Armatimonadota bacterium]
MPLNFQHRTKIVCTLGPASLASATLRGLIVAGMDVARLNFSHGTPEDHAAAIAAVQQAAGGVGQTVATLADLPGPKLRTGRLRGGRADLAEGQRVVLTTQPGEGDAGHIPVAYPHLATDLKPGDTVFLQDGEITLVVESMEDAGVACVVSGGGQLRQHAGINLPGIRLSVAAVTSEDYRHLQFAIEQGVDFVGLSFLESGDDILRVREWLRQRGMEVGLVAKIERRVAVERIDEIVQAADAVMVARGDLAVETSVEDVPVIQKEIIAICNRAGKPVITATQMLESMIEHPRPTRAEAADVANAVFDGTDALMLSGETAIGRHPVEAVAVMAQIARRAESALPYELLLRERARGTVPETAEAVASAACQAAATIGAAAIVACTHSGSTARRVARFRPRAPILGITPSERTLRQMCLSWGVFPVLTERARDIDEQVAQAAAAARRIGVARPGDSVIITAGFPVGVSGTTNFLKVVRIEDEPDDSGA